MHKLDTQIEIKSPAARVWSILLDFDAYPTWNPLIHSISGVPKTGETLKAFIHPPGGRGMQFHPKVLVSTPERELRWIGTLPVPGLFNGEHFFKIEPASDGRIVFHHGEIFSGLLVPFMKGSLDGPTRLGFIAMNEALKREAEK